MIDLARLERHGAPFPHWIGDGVVDAATVRRINAAWPEPDAPSWRIESGAAVIRKGAILFPQALPAPAQELATALFSPEVRATLSPLIGLDLQPDPWFTSGPDLPRLGGGLHEIHAGGMLGIHVDFELHPSGLRRVANLLVYLNEDWRPEWGGALELHGEQRVASIPPLGGRAVFFRTTADSWHGHPDPIRCPPDRARRSLAIYYYAVDAAPGQRRTTLYRRKNR